MRNLILLALCLIAPFLYSQETITVYITDGQDDAYQQYANFALQDPVGTMFVDSEELFIGYTPEDPRVYYYTGLRYHPIPIPRGSIIESAYVQFTASQFSDEEHQVRIILEASADPLPFTNEDYNISDRWGYGENWYVQPWEAFIPSLDQRTHNINTIVQMKIDQDDWEENDPFVFIFKTSQSYPDHPKVAAAYEFIGNMYAPVLEITFTAPATVSELQFVKQIKVFPNPATDKFSISLEELKDGEYNISLFDLKGRKVHEVYSGLLTNGDHQFNVSADEVKLEQGIYLLSIHSSRGDISRKIIVR